MAVVHVYAHFDDEYCALPLVRRLAREGAQQHFLYVADYRTPELAATRFAEASEVSTPSEAALRLWDPHALEIAHRIARAVPHDALLVESLCLELVGCFVRDSTRGSRPPTTGARKRPATTQASCASTVAVAASPSGMPTRATTRSDAPRPCARSNVAREAGFELLRLAHATCGNS